MSGEDCATIEEKRVSADVFSALFAGDIGFGEHCLHHPRASSLQRLLEMSGHGASFDRLSRLIGSAKVAIANLEAPLASRPEPALMGRKNSLAWSDPVPATKALKKAGFTALSVANDHALDCGRKGLEDTLRLLTEAGLIGFGAGSDAGFAEAPVTFRFKCGGQDRTLVVFGALEYRERYDRIYRWYTNHGLPGVNPLSPNRLKASIDSLRERLPAPIFVVFPHWGKSYQPVSNAQRHAARQLILAGADLVIGHGSHIAQPLEFIEGKPVVFGLGNCIWNTPGRYSAESVLPYSQIAMLAITEVGPPSLRLFPIVSDNMITGFQNRPVEESEFAEFAARAGEGFEFGQQDGALFLETRLSEQVR